MATWNSWIDPSNCQDLKREISKLDKTSSTEKWEECLCRLLESKYTHYLCNQKDFDDFSFPKDKWTFQHHCAYHNAPLEIVEEMLKEGFPLSFKDSDGKTPFEYVTSENAEEYKDLFRPRYSVGNLDLQKLSKIEKNFHEVIISRCDSLIKKHNLILPLLSVLLEGELSEDKTWCAIPGMYGGFSFFLVLTEDKSNVDSLVTSSWCRVVGGSGQKHICYEDKWTLVDEGFV